MVTSLLGQLLWFARALLIILYFLFCSVVVLLFSIPWPFQARGSDVFFSYLAGFGARLIGIRLVYRNIEQLKASSPCIFMGNHQSALDLFIVGSIMPPRTVVVGKQSLKWIPIFGWAFYLSGQLLLNRTNRQEAITSLQSLTARVVRDRLSVLIFPEGTRSLRTGLGKFKKGPFHLAQDTGYAIQPFVVSSFYGVLDFKRWRAGTVIIEALPVVRIGEIETTMEELRSLMDVTWKRLDAEVKGVQ